MTQTTVLSEPYDLDKLHTAIKQLEDAQRAKGTPLSGRVVHVSHYLPLVPVLHGENHSPDSDQNLLTPPRTPDGNSQSTIANVLESAKEGVRSVLPSQTLLTGSTAGVAEGEKEKHSKEPIRWTFAPRRGHTAMNSGIRSLSSTHEQLVVGWTGAVHHDRNVPTTQPEPSSITPSTISQTTIPSNSVSTEDRTRLEDALVSYVHPDTVVDDPQSGPRTRFSPVWMEDRVSQGHYEGYCKQTLWPLFHYLLWQDVAAELPVADPDWKAYYAANEAYAQKVAELYKPGDIIWIHDYHCLLVPKLLRALVPDANIGLFVHCPFPSSEVFRCLPRRKEILDGMLGANLVVFQTYSYARHFCSTCIRVCGYEPTASGGIDAQGSVTHVLHCPVGIDAARVQRDVHREGVGPKAVALKALYKGKKIIVARDKLDVVKGIMHKLKAFEKFLRDYPEWRGKVVIIQVTSPALSDSAKLERQISELVASINGEYGSLDFVPVHHYHQFIKKDEFYALLSVADLALITPFRDGMNTTSMEYVICQEYAKKSPLILSEFMGISPSMAEALQVNPWDLGDVAFKINKALTMDESEREERHNALHTIVQTHTSHTWAAVLVYMMLGLINNSATTARRTPELDRESLLKKYSAAKKRLFMLDYDGTLTPIVKTPSMAVPSEQLLVGLAKLADDPKNLVYIISGRDGEFLDQHLGRIVQLGFSAEHGCFLKEPAQKGQPANAYRNLTESLDMSWMSEVKEIFDYYTERTTGSFIERKKSSITWHYRAADPEWGAFQCKQCLDLLENNIAPKRPIEVLVGKMNLEVRPVAVNKGEIVKRLMYDNPDADFMFCAGDDKTDEDMFRALQSVANAAGGDSEESPQMEPPRSASLISGKDHLELRPVTLSIRPSGVFPTSVGAANKKTLAKWHVTSPQEIIDSIVEMASGGEKSQSHL